MEQQFYVYLLIDSSTNIPFYVGKGTNNRMYQHVREVINDYKFANRSVHSKIRQLLKLGIEIKYQQFMCNSEQEAFDMERQMILEYGRKDLNTGTLHNLTEGGEGVRNVSQETIQRRARHHLGSKRSDEAKANMKKAQIQNRLTGTHASNGTREEMRKNSTTRTRSQSERDKIGAAGKSVVHKCDNSGEVLETFDSVANAARSVGLSNGTGISKACRNFMKHTAAGFYWKLQNPEKQKQYHHVEQYALAGELICQFKTANEAAKSLNCSSSGIVRCCNGQLLTYIGFSWKYVEAPRVRKSSKRVIQLTQSGDIVATYDSAFVAMQALGLTDATQIYRCCRGQCNQSHGFIWKYEEEI